MRMFPCRAEVLFLSLVVAGVVFCADEAASQDLSCPSTTQTVTLTGTLQALNEIDPFPVEHRPCETFHVDVTFTIPNGGAGVELSVWNDKPYPYENPWPTAGSVACGGIANKAPQTCTFSRPFPNSWGGDPHPGSLTTFGRVLTVKIKATFLDFLYGAPPVVDYVITITRNPRPGYNTGGASQSDAPLLTSLPLGVKAAINPWEPRQYWKVQLAPGGTLKTIGRVRAPTTYSGAAFSVKVFNSAGTATSLKSLSVSGGAGWLQFETSTFTNTTGQTAYFWVAAEAAVRIIEVEMSIIQNDVLPQLSLFLDADDNFNPASPTTDIATYVPGASLTDGFSVSLPQTIKVIGAYIDSAGIVVPPPSAGLVNFNLSNVSAFKGVAMNASDPSHDDDADDIVPGGSLDVAFGVDNTARFTLKVWDYGGFATVTASHNSIPATPLRLPKDDNDNWIPDGGWRASFFGIDAISPDEGQRDDDDDDDPKPDVPTPPSGGVEGDALTRFEEYRGFFVNGLHIRTTPNVKDLFVSSNVAWQGASIGIQFALPNLPLVMHRIIGEDESLSPEYAPDRVINANVANAGSGGAIVRVKEQKALRVFTALADGDLGILYPSSCSQGGFTPVDTSRIEINLYEHEAAGVMRQNTATQIQNEIARTVGHEIGHGVHIEHRPAPPFPPQTPEDCVDGAAVGTVDSIMSNDWLNGPDMNQAGSQYNLLDVRQIRVRVP